MLKRLRQPERGQRHLNAADLALNLSFVLHEHSMSHAVQSAVRAIQHHANAIGRLDAQAATPVSRIGDDPGDVSHWLTATVGLPHLLPSVLGSSTDHIVSIDEAAGATSTHDFFRASAQLALPEWQEGQVGVAALVLRPDRRTSHLILAGGYDWPTEGAAAIRALERIIQAHAGQWLTPRTLWPAPAEKLLPDEIRSPCRLSRQR